MNENDPSSPPPITPSPAPEPAVESMHDAAPQEAAAPPTPPAAVPPPVATSFPNNLTCQQWAMFLHLSQLFSLLLPGAGLVAPIVIWQVYKERFPELDAHGKMVTNWIISVIIYSVIGIILTFACGVGLLVLIPLGLVTVIFPIIGGIKASEGVFWSYPLTLRILK